MHSAKATRDCLSCLVATRPGEVPPDVNQLAGTPRFAITLGFAEGSLATILYGPGAPPAIPREMVEVHSSGASAPLDDFRFLYIYACKLQRHRSRVPDKGHQTHFVALRSARVGEPQPRPDPLDTIGITLPAPANACVTA